MAGLPAGPLDGQTVSLAPDQSNLPAPTMKRVVAPDGSEHIVGETLLTPEAGTASTLQAAKPRDRGTAERPRAAGPAAPEGAPALRSTVRVEAPGMEPFTGTVDSYSDEGEVVVAGPRTGEI